MIQNTEDLRKLMDERGGEVYLFAASFREIGLIARALLRSGEPQSTTLGLRVAETFQEIEQEGK